MRARNIKPGFFYNERLVECDPLARILFIGLWCMADRRGILRDRPARIRIEVLPCDDCNVDALLNQLAEQGFIERYEVEHERYLRVINFDRHQRPHTKEKESELPLPEGVPDPRREISGQGKNQAVKKPHPPPGKNTTGKEKTTAEAKPCPSDILIPDSLNAESSLTSDSGKTSRKKPKVELSRLTLTAIPLEWAEWSHHVMGWEQDVIQDVWLNFRDYWISRTSKSAQKSDWFATWRNWCRQQNIRNGGKHATALSTNAKGTRRSKSERFKEALVHSTFDELGTE